MDLEKLLKRLEDMCRPPSSQTEVAQRLGISKQYLGDVLHRRQEPGPKILEALGIKRIVKTVTVYRKER